jgi:hypothetical protein
MKSRRLDRVVPHADKSGSVDLVTEGLRYDVAVQTKVADVHPGECIPGESGCGKEDKEARKKGVELDHISGPSY